MGDGTGDGSRLGRGDGAGVGSGDGAGVGRNEMVGSGVGRAVGMQYSRTQNYQDTPREDKFLSKFAKYEASSSTPINPNLRYDLRCNLRRGTSW